LIRYETEQQYIEYTNHRRYLATGEAMKFPNPQTDPDNYWAHYYKEKARRPGAVFETWTILLREIISPETGAVVRQDCSYDTLMYASIDDARTSRDKVRDEEHPDPGVPVSAKFDTPKEAERLRALLMQGEPGYYYDIKHLTSVAVIDRETEDGES
jgi:hypothetical protein